MADKPAATLLHLGPGLANGLGNLHNAKRAGTPIVNIVGEHATYHIQYDVPLTSDIAGYARQVSGWIRTTQSAQEIAADAAAAVFAARRAPGQIATLITPADCTWEECEGPAPVADSPAPTRVEEGAIAEAAAVLRSGEPAMLLLSAGAVRERAIEYAGRIADRCGTRLASSLFFPRAERGAGRVATERMPYPPAQITQALHGLRNLILVGARPPVSYFAYRALSSWLTPAGTQVHKLAGPEHDLADALARVAEAVGARQPAKLQTLERPPLPTGRLDPATIAQAAAALLPEHGIVVEEAITSGGPIWPATAGAPPHDYMIPTGMSIGGGMPLAVGAAVACPDRRVLNLEGDGSAAYTMQALWTQAREQLNVTTVIYANRAYQIVDLEYRQAEPGREPGPQARRLTSLGQPDLDWVNLARGMGVPAVRVETADDFNAALKAYLQEPGPNLIEAVI